MSIKGLIKKFSNSFSLDNYPDGVIIINSSEDIIGWNLKAEDIFGYLESEITGKNIAIIFDDNVNKIHQSSYERIKQVVTAKTRNGDDIITEVSCAYLNSGKDTIISVRDVTKNQKIIESLLMEYEKAIKTAHYRSGFLASYTNELKTPLHSIINFSLVLMDAIDYNLDEKQEKYISIINKNANNLLGLINNMTTLSMTEIGQIQPECKVFDVVELVDSVKSGIENIIGEKNISFNIDYNENQRKNIYSDENLLRQITQNLFTNAVKFTGGGSVNVKLSSPEPEIIEKSGIEINPDLNEKSYLMIEVKDTGIGIPDESKHGIFNEYKRPTGAIAQKYGGTGLGLAITKRLVEILGGKIWFESETGKGSSFCFIIPAERVVKSIIPTEKE